MKTIESASNQLVKRLTDLRKRRNRNETGRFLIEGHAEVRRAVAAGIELDLVCVLEESEMIDHHPVETVRLVGSAAARAAIRERGAGVIAIGVAPPLTLADLPEQITSHCVVIAEAIEKPGNLGAILRTSDAAGATAVIVADPTVDVLNPNVVRASLGTLFTVPVATASLTETLTWCEHEGLTVIALDPGAPTLLYDVDLTRPVALAVGSEHAGISTNLRAAATTVASLPMAGAADSLNAATTAGIALFEAVRQRRSLQPDA